MLFYLHDRNQAKMHNRGCPMKTIFFVQSVLLISLLSGCASLGDKLAVSYDRPVAESYWMERNPPSAPANAAEELAVKSAAGLMTVRNSSEAAYYEGQNNSFALIRHEQQSSGDESSMISVKYRIRDGLVYGESVPSYVTLLDPQKEQIAQQVAREAMNGSRSAVPSIYNGRMFVVKNNSYNSCTVDVVEKDLEREYATYRVKAC